MALVSMQLLRYAKATEEVGDWSFYHRRSILIGNGVDFWPLYKIFHSD
jgi:hypothetical protein